MKQCGNDLTYVTSCNVGRNGVPSSLALYRMDAVGCGVRDVTVGRPIAGDIQRLDSI